MVDDTISRQAALDAVTKLLKGIYVEYKDIAEKTIGKIPSAQHAQPEPLTDNEKRIFISAMVREEKICEELDRKYFREPYENSLMRVCKEIRRKVKCSLWSN